MLIIERSDEVWSWNAGSVVGKGLGSVQAGICALPSERSGMIWSGLLYCEPLGKDVWKGRGFEGVFKRCLVFVNATVRAAHLHPV